VVVADDENRLTGYTALPLNLNPYLEGDGQPEPTAGAIRPAPDSYDVVFDTPSAKRAGKFTFRFWINDQTPPRIRFPRRTIRFGQPVQLVVTDAGSGVDPRTFVVVLDGKSTPARPVYDARTGRVTLNVTGLSHGRHRLLFEVSDYQETKNMENVPPILPNTASLRATFTVR
jgi:hypothetical protein